AITDGYVGNDDEILATVSRTAGDARIYALGVGAAPNRYLLEELAAAGRGVAAFVRSDEDVAPFVRRIAAPALTDVAIDWRGIRAAGGIEVDVADVVPARPTDFFVGAPYFVYGHYARPGAGTIVVRGREGSFDVPVVFPEAADRPAVAAMWARARIA